MSVLGEQLKAELKLIDSVAPTLSVLSLDDYPDWVEIPSIARVDIETHPVMVKYHKALRGAQDSLVSWIDYGNAQKLEADKLVERLNQSEARNVELLGRVNALVSQNSELVSKAKKLNQQLAFSTFVIVFSLLVSFLR